MASPSCSRRLARVCCWLCLGRGVADTTLYNEPADAGDAMGQCGSLEEASRLKQFDRVRICIGFESENAGVAGGSGQKAIFYPRVDQYSKLTIATLEPAVSSMNATQLAPIRHMWVGTEGKRTVGQVPGWVDAEGGHCVSSQANATDEVCYGWTLHNKPVVTDDNMLVTAISVIIHLDGGRVNRVVWDNGCALCPGNVDGSDDLQCKWDGTSTQCLSSSYGGHIEDCSDCYLPLGSGCSDEPNSCSPAVHVAWVGTDKDGVPLTSAGSILSRFREYSLMPVYNSIYRRVADVSD